VYTTPARRAGRSVKTVDLARGVDWDLEKAVYCVPHREKRWGNTEKPRFGRRYPEREIPSTRFSSRKVIAQKLRSWLRLLKPGNVAKTFISMVIRSLMDEVDAEQANRGQWITIRQRLMS